MQISNIAVLLETLFLVVVVLNITDVKMTTTNGWKLYRVLLL